MKYLSLGLDSKGNYLFENPEPKKLAEYIKGAIGSDTINEVVNATKQVATKGTSYDEIERKNLDIGNPKSVGWTYLVHEADPNLEEIKRIIHPLAVHRGMECPDEPMLFRGESLEDWNDWIEKDYEGMNEPNKMRPHYILIVGGPLDIPFLFQAVLDTTASVGRVHFDSLDDLETYVNKLIRLETADAPSVDREVLFFAPNHGTKDATHFSHDYMVKPLRKYTHKELGFDTHALMDFKATKQNLVEAFASRKPALVYTASHGLGDIGTGMKHQRRVNGGIVCQYERSMNVQRDVFLAEDVPMDRPFLEGAIFYQFACFGYGTPKMSDYSHWIKGENQRLAKEDFISALPKKLLAHPQGPIAYIGHLDTAFLHAFADPEDLDGLEKWDDRISPFVYAINQLLGVQPSGISMTKMNERYSRYNTYIANVSDRVKRGTYDWNDSREERIRDTWITRSDAQNYMVFGDPAARLRIPSDKQVA